MDDLVVCPRCNGACGGQGFVCTASGDRFGFIRCHVCDGEGKVVSAVAERLRVGEIIRQQRLAQDRSGREEAKRIGADVIALNHLEHGRDKHIEPFREFRKDGWPLCPQCGEEELYSGAGMAYNGQGERPTLAQDYFSGFTCYKCNWSNERRQ